MLANQIRPTTLSAAIVFRVHSFLAKKHRELPFWPLPNKKDPEKVPTLTCEKNMIQVPKNKKLRKTRSTSGQENPKKELEPIAPNSEAESNKIYYV